MPKSFGVAGNGAFKLGPVPGSCDEHTALRFTTVMGDGWLIQTLDE